MAPDKKQISYRANLVRSLICAFILFLLTALIDKTLVCAQGISAVDIVAGYRGNASQFYKARVLYRTTTFLDKRFLVSSDPSVDLSKFNFVDPAFEVDYWTNFEDLLVRGGDVSETLVKYKGVMSLSDVLNDSILENSITMADFENRYRDVQIFTYFSKDKIVRYWLGYDTVDQPPQSEDKYIPKAVINNVIPLIHDPDFLFPPFVPFSRENKKCVFPTDVFFEKPFENTRLLGVRESGDETHFVLEKRDMSNIHLDISHVVVGTKYEKADVRICDVFKAWVNVKKGCIPVRIEKSSYYSLDGMLVGYEESLGYNDSFSAAVFEIQEIQEVNIGCFYPVKASLKFYAISKEVQEALSSAPVPISFIDILEGKAPKISVPMAVYEKKEWEIIRVIPDVEISEETLKLPFPKGTELYDDRTQKTSIVGVTEAEYEQMLRDEENMVRMFGVVPDSGMNGELPDPNSKRNLEDYIPRAPRGWRSAFLIIGVNLIILAFILRYFLLARKREKEQKE